MRSSICLNMIVKNEAHVIERCLASVKPFIDHWLIVDTGSTDGTQEKIRALLAGVPGELVERPWVDFAHNRSEAIAAARNRADYLFIIDADEILTLEDGFVRPELDRDAYQFEMLSGGVSYVKTQLISTRLDWCYKGVLHEYLYCDQPHNEAVLKGVQTLRYTDGARSRDPLTYKKDALILERALLEEPANSRYVFYLAQSYRDARDCEMALRYYQRRAEMGGWIEEVWYSLYQAADLKQRLGREWPEVLAAYLRAFECHPRRIEPLFRIAMYYQKLREFHTSHLFLSRVMQIPYPASDRLFVEKSVWECIAPMEYAVSAYWVGEHAEAIRVNNRLLELPGLPGEIFEQVIKNRRFSLDALHQPARSPSGGIRAIVAVVHYRDPGTALDNNIESLLFQDYPNFRMIFVDDGSAEDSRSRIPMDDPRVRLVYRGEGVSPAQTLRDALSAQETEDAIVVLLTGDQWLDSRTALRSINSWFDRYGCLAMWSQYRLPDGRHGRAFPLADAISFRDRTESPMGVRAFRASLLSGVDDSLNSWSGLFDTLLDTAGFDKSTFCDDILCVVNAAEPLSLPVREPVSAAHG